MSKAIPLRRSRANGRVIAKRSSESSGIGASLQTLLAPPRQLWLATLGGGALTVRGARSAWARLVAEGSAVESELRRLTRGART